MPRFGYSADISRSSEMAMSALRFGCSDANPAAAANVPADTADRNQRRLMFLADMGLFLPLQVLEQVAAILRRKRVEQLFGHQRRRQLAQRLDAVARDARFFTLGIDQRNARPVLFGENP